MAEPNQLEVKELSVYKTTICYLHSLTGVIGLDLDSSDCFVPAILKTFMEMEIPFEVQQIPWLFLHTFSGWYHRFP